MNKKSPKSKSLAIGLTGGIGSGKSLIANIFRVLGIPIFVADDVGRNLMDSDVSLRRELIQLFGQQIEHNGKLNRVLIASKVFADKNLRTDLNQLIHPRVRAAFVAFKAAHSSAPYTIQEAAILFETGGYKLMDANILVLAPEELRLQRAISRDKTSAEAVVKRMAAQWKDEKKQELADYLIDNSGAEALIPQVLTIHQILCQQAS